MKYYFRENFHLFYADGQICDQNGRDVYDYNYETIFFPQINLYKNGIRIGEIKKRFSWFMRRYDIYYEGRQVDSIQQQFRWFRSELLLEQLGWKIKGDFWALNYQIYNEKDVLVGEVSQELFRLTRHYYVDIYDAFNEDLIILLVIAINQFDKDQQAASSSAASSHHNH